MRTQSICLALAMVMLCPVAFAQWVQTFGPYGGDISCFAVSGTNLFAGTDGNGVFLSTNNGTNWAAASVGLTNPYVRALAVGGESIFAGTLEGVSLSTDNGASWTTTTSFVPGYSFTVTSLAVSGTNLFAGTTDGIFLSTNNGTSWTATTSFMTGTKYPGFVISLVVSGTNLFAGTTYWDCMHCAAHGNIFRSTDNGTNWTAIDSGLPNLPVFALAVSPNGVGGVNLFAGTTHGVYRSTNNGTSWTAVIYGLTDTTINALAVSPNGIGGENIFAGTTHGVFLSTNNGTSWTAASTGLMNSSVKAFAVSGTNLIAGTNGGGVFLSTDNGASWTTASIGLTTSSVMAFAASGTSLFAGTEYGGVFLSTDSGSRWTAANTGLTNACVYSLAVSEAYLFAGTSGGVFLSTDNGSSWKTANAGMTNCYVRAFAVSPNGVGGTNLFAGTDSGIFLTTDNGTSWTPVNNGLNNPSIYAIAVSHDGRGGTSIFASTSDSGVYLSTNNGTSWTAVNNGLTYLGNVALAVGPDGAGGMKIFGACWSSGKTWANGDVFLITNNGTSWTQVDTSESPLISSLFMSGPHLFAIADFWMCPACPSPPPDKSRGRVGTDTGLRPTFVHPDLTQGNGAGGIYLSTDNGTSWTMVDQGLTRGVNTLAISGTNLYAGTGSGVWRRPLSEMITLVRPAVQLPKDFMLEQNYPNPFNPGTTIKFELPKPSVVRLSVFDILGRQVSVLVNERKDAGVHEVKFDGSNQASGVYFYRLQTEGFVSTKTLLLLR